MTIEYKDSKRIITSPSSATSVQGYSQLNAGTNGWNIASGALDGERLSLQIVSGSSIIADPIKEIKMKLSKNSSPTDTFYVRVRNSSDTILAEASMDSSTISASLTEYTFTLNTGVILAQGDRINAEYTGSSGSGNVSCGVNNATEPSTVNCQKYDGSSYSDIDRTPDWQFDSSPSTTISILQDKPTDVQDNSILVEKDTAKRYWFESELAPTYEDDFTSDNSVDQDASKISVNTAQERWDFNIVNDQTNDSSSIDITTALSDTNWVMDFDYTWTSLSGTTNVNTSFFGISNSNGTVPSQTAQDHIGVRLQTGSGFSIAGCHSNNGTMQSGLSATFTTIPSVTTLYFRIVRTSTTSMTVKIYTTSARTTVSEEKTVAVSASTTGLRYVKISPYEGTNGGSNTEVGYVKNLKIYNAVTSVTPATWTNPKDFQGVSGLKLRLDASLGITGSSTVSAWADQSFKGDNNFVQATSGSQPTLTATNANFNNLPTVDFDGTDDDMTCTFPTALTADCSVYMVTNGSSGNDSKYFDQVGTTQPSIGFNVDGGGSNKTIWTMYNASGGGQASSSSAAVNTAACIFRLNYETNGKGYKDSVEISTNANSLNSSNAGCASLQLAGSGAGGFSRGLFSLAEFLLFDHVLSASDNTLIMTYLEDKYSL